jgi:hypothetical protein
MTGHPAGDCVGKRSIVYLRLVIVVWVCVSETHLGVQQRFQRGRLVYGSLLLFVKRMLSGTACSIHTPRQCLAVFVLCVRVRVDAAGGLCLPGPNFVRQSK